MAKLLGFKITKKVEFYLTLISMFLLILILVNQFVSYKFNGFANLILIIVILALMFIANYDNFLYMPRTF